MNPQHSILFPGPPDPNHRTLSPKSQTRGRPEAHENPGEGHDRGVVPETQNPEPLKPKP